MKILSTKFSHVLGSGVKGKKRSQKRQIVSCSLKRSQNLYLVKLQEKESTHNRILSLSSTRAPFSEQFLVPGFDLPRWTSADY
jgi:hypothetical protein